MQLGEEAELEIFKVVTTSILAPFPVLVVTDIESGAVVHTPCAVIVIEVISPVVASTPTDPAGRTEQIPPVKTSESPVIYDDPPKLIEGTAIATVSEHGGSHSNTHDSTDPLAVTIIS